MGVQEWSERIIVVDLNDDPQFTDDLNALMDLLAKRQKTDVLLNFSEVNFLNSSNIAKLLKLRKLQSTSHGKLRLCGITNAVWGIYLVTGLDKLFEFSDDVPSGLATLQFQ
ncbi:MAG: STAS domain-containing protein [Phycisphaerae bacterium]